jgi:hypothetical protein
MVAHALALLLAAAYAAAGIIGLIADVADGGDLFFWLLLLLGGAALILAGLYLVARWSVSSIAMISIGSLAGALALWWSIIVPILVIVLICLAVIGARRGGPAVAA